VRVKRHSLLGVALAATVLTAVPFVRPTEVAAQASAEPEQASGWESGA
jgi:hypothetical protein